MATKALFSSRGISALYSTSPGKCRERYALFSTISIQSKTTQKITNPSANKNVSSKKISIVYAAARDQGSGRSPKDTPPVKLLTRVEQLKLLTKAEKSGFLSAAERLGISLSTIEKLGLLSKAEQLGVLSAIEDPATPGTFLTLSLGLLLLGPSCVYFVPEDYPWEVFLQTLVALLCVAGGSAAFAASNLVSKLQNSN